MIFSGALVGQPGLGRRLRVFVVQSQGLLRALGLGFGALGSGFGALGFI